MMTRIKHIAIIEISPFTALRNRPVDDDCFENYFSLSAAKMITAAGIAIGAQPSRVFGAAIARGMPL